jgi:hypothetical protein
VLLNTEVDGVPAYNTSDIIKHHPEVPTLQGVWARWCVRDTTHSCTHIYMYPALAVGYIHIYPMVGRSAKDRNIDICT